MPESAEISQGNEVVKPEVEETASSDTQPSDPCMFWSLQLQYF
jgi:hypothetical protein